MHNKFGVKDLEYEAPRHVGGMVSILAYNFLARNRFLCTPEIKSRCTLEKAALNKEKTLFTSKLKVNLREKLVKCYIWSIIFYGADNRRLRKLDQKYMEIL
jgi:hypothetical protein